MKQKSNYKTSVGNAEERKEKRNIEKTMYPPKEDIYNKNRKEDIDLESISRNKITK
jgi:hypothetical protein